jgi:hypothetical protein
VHWVTPDNRRCCRQFDGLWLGLTACLLLQHAGRRFQRVRELLSKSAGQQATRRTIMSVVLIVLAVFFGLVVWCSGIRLCRMLLAAVRSRRTAAIRVSQDVMARPR